MPLDHKALRRQYEAAKRDKAPEKFFHELKEGFREKQLQPKDFSFRQLFENFVEDGREILDSWNPRHGGDGIALASLMEADAVNTGAFANISGQIVYNEVLRGFMNEEFVFSKLIPTTSTQFSGEKIAGIGGIGDKAEVVEEAHEYPMVGVNEDWIRTPETKKRGLIVPLTREAMFFDRTGMILEKCGEVGEYLGLNKEKRAIDCLVDENTTAHRYNRKDRGAVATYGNNSGDHDWDNLQESNGLVDWTDIDNVEQLLNAIVDPNTGEPVIVAGQTRLICTKQLEMTALRVRNATEVIVHSGGYATSGNLTETRVANPMANRFEIVTSRQLAARMATDTSWFYGDPTTAFRYMENWPLQTVQAPANSELEFSRDIVMRWKASERGQYATVEPRAIAKSTVA